MLPYAVTTIVVVLGVVVVGYRTCARAQWLHQAVARDGHRRTLNNVAVHSRLLRTARETGEVQVLFDDLPDRLGPSEVGGAVRAWAVLTELAWRLPVDDPLAVAAWDELARRTVTVGGARTPLTWWLWALARIEHGTVHETVPAAYDLARQVARPPALVTVACRARHVTTELNALLGPAHQHPSGAWLRQLPDVLASELAATDPAVFGILADPGSLQAELTLTLWAGAVRGKDPHRTFDGAVDTARRLTADPPTNPGAA